MAKRRFRIEAGRYGGELTLGTIDKDYVDYFIDKDESELIENITSYEWDGPDDTDAPKPKEDFYAWHECDDKEHLNNAYADAGFYVSEVPADGSDDHAYDENEKEIKGYHLYDREAYHDAELEKDVSDNDDYVPVLAFHSAEKGGFACWFAETDGEDFDEKKFAYSTVATTLAEIVEEVWYDKEMLDSNYDYSDTVGKGYYASVGYMNTKWHDSEPSEETLNECWESYDAWREED